MVAVRVDGQIKAVGDASKLVKPEKGGNKMSLNLDNIYKYHAPKSNQAELYQQIRDKAKDLATMFNEVCPDSRERSISHTNLETAVMWANAAIARNQF